MKIGIMQPYFFPYIGYWQMINLVDEYVIYDDVNYIKRGWMNRNQILLNGAAGRINLHIRDASQNRLILDTKVAQTEEDNRKLLATIAQSYQKAPCFEPVYALIKKILEYPEQSLSRYLENQIREICQYLEINTRLIRSSDIKKEPSLKGEEKIIAICKELGADSYINAIGGRELYHQARFEKEKITLHFLKTGEIKYRQFEQQFVPSLSIIDVMMFNEVDQIKKFLDKFTLEKGD